MSRHLGTADLKLLLTNGFRCSNILVPSWKAAHRCNNHYNWLCKWRHRSCPWGASNSGRNVLFGVYWPASILNQTNVVAFVNPSQILAQSSGVGKNDHGSESFSDSVGTIGCISAAGCGLPRSWGSRQGTHSGQGGPDAFQFPYMWFSCGVWWDFALVLQAAIVRYIDPEMKRPARS